ncbi:MAG TPA: ABC transporter permease [Xanthobacteraceae bacterium]|jgi:NitT/TauT family transport system permease protein|nr:ABC transporter permease [Xanthobacteraceae bacterium]
MSTQAILDISHESEDEKLVNETLRLRRNKRIQSVVLGFGFPLLLLVLWESAAHMGLIDRRFFPAPTTIVTSIVSILSNADERVTLLGHIASTFGRLLVGYGLGATAGVTLGLIMGLNEPTRQAVAPLLYGMFPMPKIAIYPLMIVIFGIGNASSAALVTAGVFFMTCINTLSGILYTNQIYHDVANVFRMPPLTRWFRVFIPAAMPAIVTGLRLGLGQALILVISAEFVSADTGIGRFIWDAWQVLDIPRMFMGLSIVLVSGAIAALLGNLAERHLIPWKQV